jgi:hypothetical protein
MRTRKKKLKLPITTDGWIAVDGAGNVPEAHLRQWPDGSWHPNVYRHRDSPEGFLLLGLSIIQVTVTITRKDASK